MNKLPLAITLAVVTQVTSLEAGVFSFLTGKGRSHGNQVTTGAGSKAEAKVDKNGSIVRVGSNTSAKVSDNGTVTLSKGVMLVSSGEGFLRRPPVQISTPQGDVTVRGSAIVAALPDGSVKMTVLEGNAKGMLGDRSMALNPGQLMIQRHQSRDAVKVDLGALAASSTLLDNSQYQLPLPATPVIRQEVVDQAQSLGATLTLSGANQGTGGQVVNASELKLAKNAEAAVAGAGGTMGGTLVFAGLNNHSSSAAAANYTMASGGTLYTGTVPLGSSTRVMGPLLLATTPPSIPGTNQGSIPGLVVSGSSILLTGSSITTSGIQNVNVINGLITGGASNLGDVVVTGGTLTLSNGTATSLSGNSIHGATNLVIAPGSTTTGQLITTTGATLTLAGSTVITTPNPVSDPALSGAVRIVGTSSGATLSILPAATAGSQVFTPVDWTSLGGATLNFSGSGGGALPLVDLGSLFTGSWDLSSLYSSGIVVTVGGPPSGNVPPATTTTTPPVVP